MSGKEWSSLIQRLLYAFDLTLEHLAERCEIHPSTIGRWIDGEVFPRRKNRMHVVKLFNCTSLDGLVEKVEAKERQNLRKSDMELSEAAESEGEVHQIVRLVYLVLEPGPRRDELIQKYPFLRKLARQAASVLSEQFKPVASELHENLEIIEGGAR